MTVSLKHYSILKRFSWQGRLFGIFIRFSNLFDIFFSRVSNIPFFVEQLIEFILKPSLYFKEPLRLFRLVIVVAYKLAMTSIDLFFIYDTAIQRLDEILVQIR